MPPSSTPLIIGFIADLMFTTKISNTARHLGYDVQWVENTAVLGPPDPHLPQEKMGEALHGQLGQLIQTITDRQPVLLLFDLGNEAIPWQQWIPRLKTSPATRRIPILCYGSHVKTDVMRQANRVGADAVLARSRFTSDMPNLLQKYARVPNQDAIHAACQEPLAELAQRGIGLFNQGEYYQCHDDLEEAWRQDEGDGRSLYQGILQVSVALYQIQRGNYRGAAKMLLRLRQWLEPLPDVCRGVNVAALRQNVAAIHESLFALGSDKIADFDWQIVQSILFE
ncbi:MAG: DUF309 domain-containing protein [Chloroflexi bacterium]|nr:DUF309 domain-containing protein [Chloroflexota bacterium]